MLSCDKHPYCRKCRPEVADKTARHIKKFVGHNRGQTKFTSPSIARQAITLSNKMKGNSARRPKGIHTKMPKGFGVSRIVNDEWRRKMSVSMKRYVEECGMSLPNSPTDLEQALSLLLQDADLEFEAQVQFGSRFVDFYVSSHKLAFEADGSYWHQDLEYEKKRDEELLETGIQAVIHLSEKDLDPWIIGVARSPETAN